MNGLTRRAPELWGLRRLNRMLEDAWQPFQEGELTSGWTPACDIFEDQNQLKLVLELPGVNPKDVKISLENNTLTIRGEKRQEAEEKTERVHRYERSYGNFERRFTLPSTVDAENIQAGYDNGLLTVTLPKSERARPREIPVNVK